MKNKNIPVEYVGYCEGLCEDSFNHINTTEYDDYNDIPLGVESSHMQVVKTIEDNNDDKRRQHHS